MQLAPTILEHGERYGKLTVLERVKSCDRRGGRYRCACECGYQGLVLRASQLMKGKVKACRKCASAS
jgi:hypothetical protein